MVMLPVGPMMVPMPEDMALWHQSWELFLRELGMWMIVIDRGTGWIKHDET